MKLFVYSPVTGELIAEMPAAESPLEPGVYLDQASATRIPPPMIEAGKAPVFKEGAWSLVPDHRGEKWYDENGNAVYIEELGDPTKRALSPIPPEHIPPLSDRRTAKLAELVALRDETIYAGIAISGISVQTDEKAQGRITGAALSASRDSSYTVKWKTATGAFVTLTAPEILAIADAVRDHIQVCFDREAELVDEVLASDTPELVDIAGGWPGK